MTIQHQIVGPPTFAYSDERPQAWPELLAELKKNGSSHVRAPVYWGAHETMQGVRDFSKSSRLRLEKFLNHLHALQMTADLVFGFAPGNETFPDWTKSECARTLLPAVLWDGVSSEYSLASVPSLRDRAFRDGFFGFLDDALAIVCLYQGDGPVRSVFLNEGVYGSDLPSTEDPLFQTVMDLRYGGVEKLNDRYQASFRTIGSALTKQGFRSLTEKRGWLAALDYKWCREHALNEFRREAVSRTATIALRSPLVFETPLAREAAASDWRVLLDPVLVESVAGNIVAPFNPGGALNQSSVLPYRLATYLSSRAAHDNISFELLPLFTFAGEATKKSPAIIIAGRYMTRAAKEYLLENAKAGSQFFFPFGVPQYDDEMGFLGLPGPREKTKLVGYDGQVLSVKIGEGYFFTPQTALEMNDGLWDKLSRIGSLLASEAPAC